MARRSRTAAAEAPAEETPAIGDAVDTVIDTAQQEAGDTSFDPATFEQPEQQPTVDQPQAPEQQEAAPTQRPPSRAMPVKGRPWSERFVQPVKYARFTAKDASTKEKVMFKFELPEGQETPDGELLEVVRAHKQSPEGYPTGLHFENDRVHGKVWKLPNDPLGRATADSLDEALDGLAKKIEQRGQAVG